MINNYCTIILYELINVLFVLKYSSRVNIQIGIIASCVYLIITSLLIININKLNKALNNKSILFILLGYIGLLIIAQYSINPYNIQVDRWSAINNFLVYLFEGKYPYMAQTHLGGYGSPFPVWQIVHIPFFLLHNVGLSFFVALSLFVFCIYKFIGNNIVIKTIILIVISPAFAYEALVRSDLITNFLAVAAIIIILYKKDINIKNNYILSSVICGLILSTRLSAAIPLFVFYWPQYIKASIKNKILFPLIIVTVFILTLVPLLLWDSNKLLFFEYNPFVLQTRQGSLTIIVIFIFIILFFSSTWNNKFSLLMRNISYSLFSLVALTFIYNMWQTNTWTELFASTYDITYFDMSLPFIITFIARQR